MVQPSLLTVFQTRLLLLRSCGYRMQEPPAGEISGTASCDGATIDLGSLGSAAGDTNTSVGAAVQDAVDAAGACAVGSRYDATLTVNAKSTDITVTSGYKVTAADGSNDRLSLETSDSLN